VQGSKRRQKFLLQVFKSKKKSKRAIENKTIENKILEIYTASKKCYGSPKINMDLKNFGTNISL
jgi:transcriptional/translational regulatory protein YebC/TACO1